MTKTTLLLWLGILGGFVLYLAGSKPVYEWGYYEWLAAAGYFISVLSAKLGDKPEFMMTTKQARDNDRVDRIDPTRFSGVVVLAALLTFSACQKAPPTLTPEAQIAFHATRVVKVIDVLRDAAIAANELVPPAISTNDTRTVVLWSKTSVQVIAATPGGWKPTVKASLYALTCNPAAWAPPAPLPADCKPQIAGAANERLVPYVGLALVVIEEIR